jgi:MoxR-like ATPase
MTTLHIDDVEIHLSHPVTTSVEWIGQEQPLTELLACWLTLSAADRPLTPRIIGHPGLGKTTLAMAAAKRRDQSVYVMQCTADTRPEDLVLTPVLDAGGKIRYQASPLLSAVVTGGVAVLDEGNRMSEKSWASLAPLLDDRRTIDSLIAGITLKAHPDFRCAVTMNEDDSTFEIPDYILSRIQPSIEIPFPGEEEELRILSYNLPDAPEELLRICVGFLQKAHALDLPYSIRDGLNAIRFASKMVEMRMGESEAMFERALMRILGEEALDLEKVAKRRRQAGLSGQGLDISDFFFDDDSPINPMRPGP